MRRVPLALILLASCSELEVPTPPPPSASAVLVEPAGSLEAAPAVLRLRMAGVLGRSALADFRLFEGELSAYYQRRLAAGEVSEALLEREIPVLVWPDGADAVVAPLRALSSGRYSLVTPELGLLAEVTVDDGLVPWLERLWPPRAERYGSGFAVFCGPAASLAEAGPVTLEPAGSAALLRSGIGVAGSFAAQCVSLEPSAPGSDGAPALPPALAGGVGLEPLASVMSSEPVAPARCDAPQLTLGPACAELDDDRVLLRAPEEPALFVIEEPAPLLGVAAPGASLVLLGLEPGTSVPFRAHAFDRSGAGTSIERLLTLAERRPHVVINEVLANPAGPEEGGEWLELVNDGEDEVELEGFELRDAGGAVPLPSARLAPGEYLLLVPRGFAPDLELDVSPAPGTRALELDALGRSGLANGGELLRLSDPSGRVLSRFPALKASQAGTSLARRTPEAPDDEASSFGLHAEPGASPGAPNTLP